MENLVEIQGLTTSFWTQDGMVVAVDDVSFVIRKGDTLGLVGESGSGKSVTALSIMRLVPVPPGKHSGRILFGGRDLLSMPGDAIRKIRGKDIAMVFQEPMSSLNPVYTVGDQIAEVLQLHQGQTRRQALASAEEMLDLVAVPDPKRCVRQYPHEFSGGMRQRAMIAMALSCRPSLLIADEPTTALDVTVQAQILELMKTLKAQIGMTIMLITHDLGVIAEMCDRVVVMYCGKVVEEASVEDLFRSPLHPYSKGLYDCIPRIDRPRADLTTIQGLVPNPFSIPTGCRFHPRCQYCSNECRRDTPGLVDVGRRRVACHHPLAQGAGRVTCE